MPHAVTRKGVSYVPQLDNVFPNLTVQENLELGAIAGGDGLGRRARWSTSSACSRGSRSAARQAAGTMSGGERQMVAMGRALMPDPEILLLDEPSAGLAPAFVDAIFEKVLEINASGVTILMVEQNARRALAMSHRGYVLDLGHEPFHRTRAGADRRPQGRRPVPGRRQGPGRRRGVAHLRPPGLKCEGPPASRPGALQRA